MRAVTFQAPGEVAVEERPDPEPDAPTDAVVRIESSGVCGSDLHLYHGRIPIEQGFTLGHEFVGTVVAAGDQVTEVAEGDRVVGCFLTACGRCFFCRKGLFQKCDHQRVFGHGANLGDLQGAQADAVLVPHANLTLRRVPDGMTDENALFAGDVMGTGFHAIRDVGLCAVQAARVSGAAAVIAVDTVPERLEMARSFGATPVHLTEQDLKAEVRDLTEGRGADVVVEAVGSPEALDTALRLARKVGRVSVVGVHDRRVEVHMGLAWIKSLHIGCGHANVIGHIDEVLALMAAGVLDPSPIVTHHMTLDEAPEAYELYDRREALKIVLTT
jgi:2-desacetyl-2-hydroxyethyl bacteriochlorophyllide A dehydrogenase